VANAGKACTPPHKVLSDALQAFVAKIPLPPLKLPTVKSLLKVMPPACHTLHVASSCVQLGYMVFDCGISNNAVGVLHLMNHAINPTFAMAILLSLMYLQCIVQVKAQTLQHGCYILSLICPR